MLVSERLRRPLRSRSFRRLAFGKSISYLGDWLMVVVLGSRPIVFAFVGLCGLLAMVSTVAGNALIPMVVEPEELAAANGIHAVGQEAAMALGAVAGGLTLAVGG